MTTGASRFTVSSLDLLQRAAGRAGVARGGTDQDAEPLLLEDVRRPAGCARAGEHRGRELRRHLGDIEDDSRPVLDVGPRVARALPRDRLVRDLFEFLRNRDTRRTELLRDALEHARARIFGPV